MSDQNTAADPPHDPETGEIKSGQIMADRRNEPWAAATIGAVIDMLERGQLSADAYKAMTTLGQGMTELGARMNKRVKGKLTVTLTLTTEGDAFFIEGDFKVTAPKEPRPRTMAWQADDGRFMPSMPKQKLLMGIAGTEMGPRIVSGEQMPPRSV